MLDVFITNNTVEIYPSAKGQIRGSSTIFSQPSSNGICGPRHSAGGNLINFPIPSISRLFLRWRGHHHQERTPPTLGHGCPTETIPSSPILRSTPGGEKADAGCFRSASTVRGHVCAGLPLRLFRSRRWP